MDKSTPKVSCIIPTYKRSETLINAINSILNQSYKNIEIIVVDDNEPNDEYSIKVQNRINKIKDDRLLYLQQEKHQNGAVARNFGVLNSKGDFIAFLDDDDEWEPEKIKIQVETLITLDSSYGAVASLTKILRNNKVISVTKPFTEDKLQQKVLERRVSFNTSTVLFRKEALIEMGMFNEKLNRHQDLQLFVDFLEKYKIKGISLPLTKYNVDDSSNRPNTEQLIRIKSDYFRAISTVMSNYNQKERKNILAAHYFEIIYVALRERKIQIAFRYLMRIGFNFQAVKTVFQRYFDEKLN